MTVVFTGRIAENVSQCAFAKPSKWAAYDVLDASACLGERARDDLQAPPGLAVRVRRRIATVRHGGGRSRDKDAVIDSDGSAVADDRLVQPA
jgi:hypothetical protein